MTGKEQASASRSQSGEELKPWQKKLLALMKQAKADKETPTS